MLILIFRTISKANIRIKVGASPKDNKKNYLKLKIFAKRVSMNLEIICVFIKKKDLKLPNIGEALIFKVEANCTRN
ncbi:CLUMA_CG000947, isoform A [Clunio marinus]|uniref:CLUMA_CG000947, isoform A n=1 Tax=Clunio marinus TaxID=568069 RepID=A0A1J1HHV8_9DIPT|nr:CLUMA_CG000947, isoform A [Clunio marinus]